MDNFRENQNSAVPRSNWQPAFSSQRQAQLWALRQQNSAFSEEHRSPTNARNHRSAPNISKNNFQLRPVVRTDRLPCKNSSTQKKSGNTKKFLPQPCKGGDAHRPSPDTTRDEHAVCLHGIPLKARTKDLIQSIKCFNGFKTLHNRKIRVIGPLKSAFVAFHSLPEYKRMLGLEKVWFKGKFITISPFEDTESIMGPNTLFRTLHQNTKGRPQFGKPDAGHEELSDYSERGSSIYDIFYQHTVAVNNRTSVMAENEPRNSADLNEVRLLSLYLDHSHENLRFNRRLLQPVLGYNTE